LSALQDLVVIGAGIAGLSAARHAVAGGASVTIVESLLYGGLVTNVNELDGEVEGSGVDLAAGLLQQARKTGAAYVTDTVQAIALDGDTFAIRGDSVTYRSRGVVIASGARLRRLGVPGEAQFKGRGVSSCADCDAPFYRDLDVVVVGGGDSALQEAAVIAGFARHVQVVHRGASFRARPHLVEALSSRPNVIVHWNTRVEAILGDTAVKAVRIRALGDAAPSELACAGFFAYVGLEPASGFAPTAIARDVHGALVTDAALRTSVPGLCPAGAVRSGYSGVLKDAIAEGAAAAGAALAAIRK